LTDVEEQFQHLTEEPEGVYIKDGECIKVDTRTGEFLSRA
jgi:hypothetical protein